MALQLHVNASDFFASLTNKARRIAEEEGQIMAEEMLFTLRHRFPMKGGGRYPKWDPSEFDPQKTRPLSNNSYKNWEIQKRSNGEYWLSNDTTVEWRGKNISYPKILATGKGWSYDAMYGDWKRLTFGPNGGIFSTWMPQGMEPWFKLKRSELEGRIAKRFLKELP